MSHLYLNYNNKPVNSHSYSGGERFRFCKRRYYLERLQGWREREQKASLHFGRCVEDALKYHVDNKNSGGEEDFLRRWDKVKEIPDLTYTDKEGDWDKMKVMGGHMLQLFSLWWLTAGLTDPKWQLEYKKEVFPNAPELRYRGLEFTAYIDLRAIYQEKPLLVDIKTAGSQFTDDPAMLQLDPQLSDYSWVSGIPDVAFLVLIKGGDSFKKGDTVTLLDTGFQQKVLFANDGAVTITDAEDFEAYEIETKGVKGKELGAVKAKYAERSASIPEDQVTKCRIQFLTTTMPADNIREAGEIEAQNIVDIVQANQLKRWPKDGAGIRFPNNKCSYCPMRGICTGNDLLRDELLIKLGPAVVEEPDWMDAIGE
jgi:PD-(D/E)XK nuclease superfamily